MIQGARGSNPYQQSKELFSGRVRLIRPDRRVPPSNASEHQFLLLAQWLSRYGSAIQQTAIIDALLSLVESLTQTNSKVLYSRVTLVKPKQRALSFVHCDASAPTKAHPLQLSHSLSIDVSASASICSATEFCRHSYTLSELEFGHFWGAGGSDVDPERAL
jgi:hypothetical protein